MYFSRHAKLLVTILMFGTALATAQSAREPLAGFWSGTVERNSLIWRVELNATVEAGELKTAITFIDLDVPDVPFPVKSTDGGYRLERPQPSGNPIVFDGTVKNDIFAGRWAGFGVEGDFSMKRSTKPERSYREEDIEFVNGHVKLSGTLMVPTKGGKHPAVVITHGSMPNERATYRSVGRQFVEAGIAALIYDKRGAGKSTGNTRSASMEDLADDAIAGVRLLKGRPDVDAARIGVMGHSQGGWIAPLAAVRSRDVAFVIATGVAAVTPAEQSIYHRAGVMRSLGMSDDEIEQASRLRRKLYDLNRKIINNEPYQRDRSSISQELIAHKDARWFGPAELPPQLAGDLPPLGALELLFFDPTFIWRKLRLPVLVVWGDRDTVVPVEKSREIIERLQTGAGNKQITIKILPGVDHGNNLVRKDGGWDFPRVEAEYFRTIVQWAQKTVT